MNFIGRQQELELLEREYQKQGSFVVIYGRRRIGKTTLIREFIKNKRAFYFLATEEIEAQGKKRLADVVARTTGNSMLQRVSFSDWLDLFRLIAKDQPGEKKVLVIDEFPYLVKANPAFPSILQKAWDEILKDANVMLILCGSLISMMQKYALAYDSPLYGRRTAQIRLGQLSFPEVYKARKLSFSDAVEQYAVTGGVPKYLEMFNDQEPLLSQLESVALSKNGFLYEEPNFLLKDEVMSSVSYFSILRIIAEGNHRLSKIAGALETGTSALTPYLSTLSELGFISRETPVTEKKPEKSRRGLYFISDNFMRFWFRYVYPFKGELELDNPQIVLDELEKRITLYQRQAAEDETKIKELEKKYAELENSLEAKQAAADDIARLSLREANEIIGTAKKNADQIINEALGTARLILTDLSRLYNQAGVVKGDMYEQIDGLRNDLDAFQLPKMPDLRWLDEAEKKMR